MAKLPLSLILALFLVKATVAAPSTEARFKDEAESGKTQEHPYSVWTTKLLTKIKTVVMESLENIENWKSVAILKELKSGQFNEELASLKSVLTSHFDGVITDVQNKLKGTVYFYSPPNHAQCCTLARFTTDDFETNKASLQCTLKVLIDFCPVHIVALNGCRV